MWPQEGHRHGLKATCNRHSERGEYAEEAPVSLSEVGAIQLRLPAPACVAAPGSSFVGYPRTVPGTSCRSDSRWDPILLSQPGEFAVGLLVG